MVHDYASQGLKGCQFKKWRWKERQKQKEAIEKECLVKVFSMKERTKKKLLYSEAVSPGSRTTPCIFRNFKAHKTWAKKINNSCRKRNVI